MHVTLGRYVITIFLGTLTFVSRFLWPFCALIPNIDKKIMNSDIFRPHGPFVSLKILNIFERKKIFLFILFGLYALREVKNVSH